MLRPTLNPPPSVTLEKSGLVAELSSDRYSRDGVVLRVDGIAQSQVNLVDPGELQFEYIRRIGHAIDLFRPAHQPITAIHLGAGALTLPRYIAHTRPGSRSQVIEWERELVKLVRQHIPWDKSWSIRVRYGDARDVLGALPQGLAGSADLVVVDLFSGNHTPSHLTTREFYQLITPLLRPDGLVAINMVDGRPQTFVKSQCHTLSSIFGFVGVVGESGVIRGRRFGNVIAIASITPHVPEWWSEMTRRGPHPTSTLSGVSLERFMAGATPQTDARQIPSPTLGSGIFSSLGDS